MRERCQKCERSPCQIGRGIVEDRVAGGRVSVVPVLHPSHVARQHRQRATRVHGPRGSDRQNRHRVTPYDSHASASNVASVRVRPIAIAVATITGERWQGTIAGASIADG